MRFITGFASGFLMMQGILNNDSIKVLAGAILFAVVMGSAMLEAHK